MTMASAKTRAGGARPGHPAAHGPGAGGAGRGGPGSTRCWMTRGFAAALREELDFRIEARNIAAVAGSSRVGVAVGPQ